MLKALKLIGHLMLDPPWALLYSTSFMFLILYERIAQLFLKMHLRLIHSLGKGLNGLHLATSKAIFCS